MVGHIDSKMVDVYSTFLVEQYRPPSRGGNTSAMHQHRLQIEGNTYSFLARGARKWVFSTDSVTFDWKWDGTGKHRNLLTDTVKTVDKKGNEVVRGDRRTKTEWRTAPPRPPVSRREQRN